MAIIKPFRALHPVPEKAEQVSCVPYDVAYESEVRDFIKNNPNSFLHVTRPEAEFAEDANPSAEIILERAKHNLEKLIDDGILALESEPCFYVYRLAFENHRQTGIVACCSLDEYEHGLIKKHEKTRPDKVEDRTAHMLSVKAQTGLIFLAYRGTGEIRRLIGQATSAEPLYHFECTNGIQQTVWRIAKTDEFTRAFVSVPALYIADGHHRVESARLARKSLRYNNPDHNGTEEYNFVVSGIFPAEDLRILAYNRVVKDLNGLSEPAFLTKLTESFAVSETETKEPQNHREFGMYLNGKWYKLQFAANHEPEPDPLRRLDVSILQRCVLEPILGIDDPSTNERIGFVGGGRGTDELEKLVDDGDFKVAFSLYPTTMDDLFAVSDTGGIMPPKSTWFEPKLKDGLFVHLI
ncbi:MAG: DUF1015 domain-containing protein [Pyrinomonadaceae bacterium]